MSRDITNQFRDVVTSQHVSSVMLITMDFSQTLRLWNGIGLLTYNGHEYTGSGNALSVDAIHETNSIEARGTKFVLSGVNPAIVAIALAEPYQGRRVTIEYAVLDDNGVILPDPYPFFAGYADNMDIEAGRDTATVTLSVENELIALKRASDRRRTHEDQQINYPGDSFFSRVASIQDKKFVWGRNG